MTLLVELECMRASSKVRTFLSQVCLNPSTFLSKSFSLLALNVELIESDILTEKPHNTVEQ